METLKVVVPHGMLVESEHHLEATIRRLSELVGDPQSWPAKYSAPFENDVFMLHPFCWCEKEDCPWCEGCKCPDSAFHYYVDGKEVAYKEWDAFFHRIS